VPFYKLSDVIHASVACGVDFNHIQGGTISDRFADLTHAARLFRRFIPFRQLRDFDPGAGSFAGTSGTSEQISGAIFDVRIAFVRVVAIASDRPDRQSSGAIFMVQRLVNIGIKQVPYSAWGCNPQAFALGGGKDGFGDRFILPIPPYPDH